MALARVETLEELRCATSRATPDEVQALYPGLPDHGHLLLPRPGHLPGPARRGPASAAEGSAARRARAGVGARVRHRRGGLFDRHLPAGSRGSVDGTSPVLPGLRHRPHRERPGEGARRDATRRASPRTSRRHACSGSSAEVDGGYQVIKAIRDMCVFARHDLTRDPAVQPHRPDQLPERAHLPRAAGAAAGHGHLPLRPQDLGLPAPGGVGDGERGRRISSRPWTRSTGSTLKRPTAAPTVFGLRRARETGREGRRPRPVAGRSPLRARSRPREADRILLARYAPAGVIVDEKDYIVEFRGQTDPYLEHAHGRASLNLFKMARKGLLLELRQAVQEARKKDAPVRKEGLSLRHRGQRPPAGPGGDPAQGIPGEGALAARALRGAPRDQEPERGRAAAAAAADGAEARENARLRQELAEATRYLQAVTRAARGGQRGAAGLERGDPLGQRGAAEHQRGAGDGEGGAAVEQRGAGDPQPGAAGPEPPARAAPSSTRTGSWRRCATRCSSWTPTCGWSRANRAFYDYFRVTPEETVGRLVYELGERAVGHSRAAADAGRAPPPRPARIEDVEVEHDFPRLGRRTLVRQRAQAPPRERPARASCWPSRTGPRPGTRRASARRCSPWSRTRGSGPSRPIGSRTSSWRPSPTSCAGRSTPWWDGSTSCATSGIDEATRERGTGGHRAERQGADAAHRGPAGLLEVGRGQAHPVAAADGPRAGGGRGDRGGPLRGRGQGDPARAGDGCRGGDRPRRSGPAAAGPLEPPVERGEVHAAGRARRGLDRAGG